MALDKDIIKELEVSPEAISAIVQTVKYNALSFEHCAKICQIMAPLCNQMSAGGAINWLQNTIERAPFGIRFNY